MTETELEYQFCFNCNDRKQCYTKPKDCTRIQEEIGLQSNIEWMREASLEELAEFMWNYTHDLITDWEHINDPMFRQLPLKNILGDNCTRKNEWVEWLKQPHTIKE